MIKLHEHAYLLEPTDPNPIPMPTGQAWAIAQNGTTASPTTTVTDTTTYATWDNATRAVLYIQQPQIGLRGRPYSPIPEHALAHQALNQQRHTLKTARNRTRKQVPSQNSTLATNATTLWKSHVFGDLPLQNTLPRRNMTNATIASTAEFTNGPTTVRMRIQTQSGQVLLDTGNTPATTTQLTMGETSIGLTVAMANNELTVTWRFSSMEQVAAWSEEHNNSLYYRVAFGSMVDKRGQSIATAWSAPIQFRVNSVPSKPSVY